MRRLSTVAALCAAFCALTTPASAATMSGSTTDAAGDAANPAHDLLGAAVVYDSAGGVRGTVSTQAQATESAVTVVQLALGVASVQKGICEIGFDVDILPPDDEFPPFATFSLGATELRHQWVQQEGGVIQFDSVLGDDQASGLMPQIAEQPYNCAYAGTYGPQTEADGDTFVVDDETEVFALTSRTDGTTPSCVVTSQRARRGKARLRCSSIAGKVTIRVYLLNRKLRRTRSAQIRKGGSVVASLRGLKRGRVYDVTAWDGATFLGGGAVRLR